MNHFPYKNFIIELLVALFCSSMISLFTDGFFYWLIFFIITILIWHHYSEYRFLRQLDKNKVGERYTVGIWETISQTLAYQKRREHQEKRNTLRFMSRLNRNIKSIPDAVIICSKKGTILWCNIAAQEMFSFYWNKKMPQKSIFSAIFYPEFRKYFDDVHNRKPFVLMPNNDLCFEITRSYYGEDDTYLFIARNITQMVKLLQSRQLFLSNLNHELRTPLTVLQGYLELFENPAESSQEMLNRGVKVMQGQVSRMERMVSQLTTLVKIETDASVVTNEIIDMSAIFTSLEQSSEILSDNKHEVIFNIDRNLNIYGDETRLNSAVSNLVFNALRYSGKGSKIVITWKKRHGNAYFSVKDNGVGISQEHIPHLTERFYRVDDSRNQKHGGSGIGLAIVKHVLLPYHSQLKIDSILKKGSKFSFEINKRFIVNDE